MINHLKQILILNLKWEVSGTLYKESIDSERTNVELDLHSSLSHLEVGLEKARHILSSCDPKRVEVVKRNETKQKHDQNQFFIRR